VKRSIGTKSGACKDAELLERYSDAPISPIHLNIVKKQLGLLLQDNNGFRAGLATTFGQPIAKRDRNISLITRKISIKTIQQASTDSKPREFMPYLSVQNINIPITFPLFKSLDSINIGLQEASLPEEVFALLDSVKSKVSGRVVRDMDFLEDELTIEIGTERLSLEIESNQISVEQAD
jgi:hypothetical protein